jgi:hypothetical protein
MPEFPFRGWKLTQASVEHVVGQGQIEIADCAGDSCVTP